MSSEELAKFSKEEELLLRHEAFIARVLQERNRPAQSSGLKPWWQRLVESQGGTALITVVIGGIFGALISGIFQWGAKEREFQQSWLKARGDQAMVAYKDFVEKRAVVVEHLYQRIGSSVSSSEDLIELSKGKSTVRPGLDDKTREAILGARKTIVDKFDLSNSEWRNERDSLGFLIDYYHPDQKDVVTAWHGLKKSISDYLDCAAAWHESHPIDDDTSKACPSERASLTKSLEQFTSTLGSARTYAWTGWESPEALRNALNK
ncbi:MAG TPA: hypothetical protein VMZ30_06100 [Pyrinomonadaceae bacterium]|nr:hypothetical protein [Pyrinomonadaceae bacterium]